MNKVIHKYSFPIADCFVLSLPAGAKVLHIGFQKEVPCMWVLVDPEQATTYHRFRIYGTGHLITHENLEYIGTIHESLGWKELVWHVFEEVEHHVY